MIDERHEELASLYALDLLEGAERAQFEATLAGDPELQTLVRELRNTSSRLAYNVSTPPPAALKQRLLDSISSTDSPAAAKRDSSDNVVRPFGYGLWRIAPWAAAACFAIAAAWMGQRYATTRSEADALRNQQALTDVQLKLTLQQLEAERLVMRRQVQDSQEQLATANTQLGEARTQLTERERLLAEARNQLGERDRLLADARTQLGERERQVATLTQRVDALAGASAEIGKQLGESKEQIARLTSELKSQSDLANLQITALVSMVPNAPKALAAVVWDPVKQAGVIKTENLPPLLASQDYQLWIVDPQYPDPVDGGVFTVDAQTGVQRVTFNPKQPVRSISALAVTRERKGGVVKSAGPFILLGK